MSFWLYPYNPHTEGGTALIRALGGKKIVTNGRSRFRPSKEKIVINWGAADAPFPGRVINNPNAIAAVVNKLEFFRLIEESPAARYLPEWRDDPEDARQMLDMGRTLVCRTVLNGHSGRGIVICKPGDALPQAPLYTRYIPKDEEWRVHLIKVPKLGGETSLDFFIQKKVKRKDFQGKPNRQVRCYDNGYTYQHSNIQTPEEVIIAAKTVFRETGLDFGAVDVIFCKKENEAYVLEVNTAPGIEGETIKVYADTFKKYF